MLHFDQQVIDRYLDAMANDEYHRYWSWDYCFNVFFGNDEEADLSLSLAAYLASWGMYRGSGGLLQKNHRVHKAVVKIIRSDEYNSLRCSEDQEVNSSLVPLILSLKRNVGAYYSSLIFTRGGSTRYLSDTDTLLSKILLGTVGCVPAYDRFFVAGLRKYNMKHCKFTADSLLEIFDFIKVNEAGIKQ